MQPRRMFKSSHQWRSVHEAWGKEKAMQPRRMHKSSCQRRSVHQKWCKEKLCNSEGCTNKVVQGGICIKHGAKKKLAKEECAKDMEVRNKEEYTSIKEQNASDAVSQIMI